VKRKLLFEDADVRIQGTVELETGRSTIYEFELLAESYRETANRAVEALASDEAFLNRGYGSIAFRAWPIIFLYRQALELTLKAIIIAGAPMIEYHGGEIDMRIVYSEHNFEKLRPMVEQVMEQMRFGWNFDVAGLRSLQDFRKLLAEFDDFDPTSTVCRYPVNGAGKPSMDNARCFNLFKFAAAIDTVLEAIAIAPNTIDTTVDQYFSYAHEMT
jgi:hypothetical protein